MADFPFWDEDCFANNIDQPNSSAQPRSLFDNDLFCNENALDVMSQIFTPLPSSPQIPTPSKILETSRATDVPFSLNLPTYEQSLSPPAVHFDHFPTDFSSPSLSLPSTSSFTQSINSSLNSDRPNEAPRQWSTFLDDSCPLRKRVKITIIPTLRKLDRQSVTCTTRAVSSPPLKKPRHSHIRVTTPHTLQTKFRIPLPSEPCARLTLQFPSSHAEPTDCTPSTTPTLTTLDDTSPDISMDGTCIPSPISNPTLSGWEFNSSSTTSMCTDDPSHSASAENQVPPLLTSALVSRLSQIISKPSNKSDPTYTSSSLPFVGVAVQAVTRAAKVYSGTVASVTLPVAINDASKLGKRHTAQQGKGVTKVSKKRKILRNKRTLLSFDDKDVKPLVDDDFPTSPEHALSSYLNFPSPTSFAGVC